MMPTCENKDCNREATTDFAGIEVCQMCYDVMNRNSFIVKKSEDLQKGLGEWK